MQRKSYCPRRDFPAADKEHASLPEGTPSPQSEQENWLRAEADPITPEEALQQVPAIRTPLNDVQTVS